MSKWVVDIHGEIEGDYEIIKKYEEPKTGQWIEKGHFFEHGTAKCSCCGKRDHVIGQDTGHGGYDFTFHDYCPNCGAKMMEGKD